MCGTFAILDIKSDPLLLRSLALKQVKKIRHRGPDWSGIFSDDRAILAHERLSIVDVESGAQPLYNKATKAVLAVNGEIYNHIELRERLTESHSFQTHSDCEVILYLYQEYGVEFLEKLNGIFAFVLYDPSSNNYLIARDHLGIVPLYIGWDKEGNLFASSEMKSLVDICPKIIDFPPGHYFLGNEQKFRQYYLPSYLEKGYVPQNDVNYDELRTQLEDAVKRQLMSDVPYGLLISGGVDSSIIASIAAKFSKKRIETAGKSPAWWPQVHSFSVGLEGAPDLKYARMVADYIGAIHHEIHFTVQEGLDAIRDVIYHLETFDITTIRAATPMYLMSRKIRAMGIKMILSGEGADEVFGGYLYFHKAPNPVELQEELVRKVSMLYKYDCLRANKAMAAWGVEARVPFLDKEFLAYAMELSPQVKMSGEHGDGKIEKFILRKAFEGYIPDEVLWRQKEQFSDGVGYSWIDSLKAIAEEKVSDQMMDNAQYRFLEKTPVTKEGYWYRTIFEEFFPSSTAIACIPDGPSIACSTPTAIKWDASFANSADPSGRAVKTVHIDAYEK